MGHRSLQECVADLEARGMLVRVEEEVDPDLEVAAVVRTVYRHGGPALLFTRPRGCRFPLLGNLYGTLERARYIFRDTLDTVRSLVELKGDPAAFLRNPWRYRKVPKALYDSLPLRVSPRSAPVLARREGGEVLPAVRGWPRDGGAYITLPVVYTEDPDRPGWMHSNMGMYRVQIDGGEYQPGREIGLHYQLHRGIGIHHSVAARRGEPLQVRIFVGGPPALTLAAIMPLPEDVPEIALAGALGGRRVRLVQPPGHALPLAAEADFCIVGHIDPSRRLPEGPFGDHLGYYSLVHDFPVMVVDAVYHRRDAIWPFTTVGRPPQEDTTFGDLVHEISGPAIPAVLPGVRAVNAVDAAGVHPLLLAIGSERYTPYEKREAPRELLTQAHAILGHGQLSLSKYVFMAAWEDDASLDVRDLPGFFRHVLERVRWERDLHFETRTTIDTLDYSGTALHQGSKLVVAAVGPPRRALDGEVPADLVLPAGFSDPRICLPGVLAVRGPAFSAAPRGTDLAIDQLCRSLGNLPGHPLVVVVDDSVRVASSLSDFLWIVFTRSNPAADVHGVGATTRQKHWGCTGPLVVDARIKPHHAPPLEEDEQIMRRVLALAARGGSLHGVY